MLQQHDHRGVNDYNHIYINKLCGHIEEGEYQDATNMVLTSKLTMDNDTWSKIFIAKVKNYKRGGKRVWESFRQVLRLFRIL